MKNSGSSSINQTSAKENSNGVGKMIGTVKKTAGKSAEALDNMFRKPFTNMGETKTGKH